MELKKIAFALMISASPMAFAASGTISGSATGGSASLTVAECEMIASGETANIKLSKEVEGAYNCDASAAGVGTAHPQGKGKSYTASSNGGAITETSASSGKFTNASAASTAAATAAAAGQAAS